MSTQISNLGKKSKGEEKDLAANRQTSCEEEVGNVHSVRVIGLDHLQRDYAAICNMQMRIRPNVIVHFPQVFQTRLHDLLWLELLAWRYGLTMKALDEALIQARYSCVPDVLADILDFEYFPSPMLTQGNGL